ncbi:MAG: helix-turn-helix transcriptional regulator [Rhodomicrobium sp.]
MAAITIDRFIEDTNLATSSKGVSRLFGNALKDLGYDRFCYSLITAHPSMGLDAGHGVVKNYPDDWMAHYRANRYEKKDPVPRHGLTTARPFTWDSVVQSRELKPEQKKVMNEAREAHLLDGIAIPICGHNGELAGVGVASSTGGIRPDINLLNKIRALALQFHLVYTELEGKDCMEPHDTTGKIHLTAREKEILLWAAEGKSDSVIADIIGVSHATIRFHMKNIFNKLNANERTLATVKAIRHGLILPSYVR